MNRYGWICFLAAGALIFGIPRSSHAVLVTGWGAETGFANGTVTDNGGGSVTAGTPTGNLGVRALMSTISLPNVGDGILLTGTFVSSKPSGEFGNQQLRFGLYDTNSQPTGTLSSGVWSGATTSDWRGYFIQVGNNPGTTSTTGRNNTGAWLSGTGAYIVGTSNSPAEDPLPGTYTLSLSLLRTAANAVTIIHSVIQTVGGTYTSTNTVTDTGGTSSAVSATDFNAVGIFLNAQTGGGTFSNMDVSTFTVPEVSAFACCAIAAVVGQVLMLRRSRV
jgi:hypothetical protein